MSSEAVKINLSNVIEDIFMVLTPKEKEVVIKRFALDHKEKRTLESIGRGFNVTRERVRQIEKIALTKLRRTVSSTKFRYIYELAQAVLKEEGGILLEETLIQRILSMVEPSMDVDEHVIRLGLTISPGLEALEKNNFYHLNWRLGTIPMSLIKSVLDTAIQILKTANEIIPSDNFISTLQNSPALSQLDLQKKFLQSVLTIDCRIMQIQEGYGLSAWRHVNPKSIRDKALIVLRRANAPLHFTEIARRIKESDFDEKNVTVQAVHNELIRYPQFVLVGRGLYGLKEWGYSEGTVADIIEDLLKKKSPMTKKEITDGVLNQRSVKKGTISLNLQKNPHFVRVGRAVYALDLSKK